jgi:hypothetical protein
MRLAAEQAEIAGFTGLGKTLPGGLRHAPSGFAAAMVDERLALVRDAAGARFDQLELHVLVQVVRISRVRQATAEDLAKRMPGMTPAEVLESPYLLFGTAPEIAAQIQQARERWGFSYFSTFRASSNALAEVIPLLR